MQHDRYRAARRVTWLSIATNLALGSAKVAVGWWANSRALVADGVHSLTDLGTDAAILLGIRLAERPPDAEHPYGHHKVASLVSLFIAGSILVLCAGIVWDSAGALLAGTATAPHWPALAVALGSIAAKEWLFRRTRAVARASRSSMVLANAWHHRTDGVTSVVAATGIAAALWLGDTWAFLDAAVGILLGAYLGVEGLKLLVRTLADLVDAAPERSVIDDLREHILPIPGVVGYHEFRARRVGDMIEVDMHLLVAPERTVQEGHAIASTVEQAILERHPEVINVLIHVEPAVPEFIEQRGVAGMQGEGGGAV